MDGGEPSGVCLFWYFLISVQPSLLQNTSGYNLTCMLWSTGGHSSRENVFMASYLVGGQKVRETCGYSWVFTQHAWVPSFAVFLEPKQKFWKPSPGDMSAEMLDCVPRLHKHALIGLNFWWFSKARVCGLSLHLCCWCKSLLLLF